jgi:rhodanese-related sulfurtransferase
MRMTRLASLVVVCLGLVFMAAISARAAEAPRMSMEELKSMIDDPNVIVIDVRQDSDLAESNAKIKGAVRENPAQSAAWMSKYPKEKTIVFYCS